jgi:uncharacterized protein YqcC (DUF446 family)
MSLIQSDQDLLLQLQTEMQALNIWQSQSPNIKRLASTEPFAIDTLTPQEWLQWIFIPKMKALFSQGYPLPKALNISPYFEESWQGQPSYTRLLTIIKRLEMA